MQVVKDCLIAAVLAVIFTLVAKHWESLRALIMVFVYGGRDL